MTQYVRAIDLEQKHSPTDMEGRQPVLVVDLDQTLCRTDTLHESLMRLATQKPLALLALPLILKDGKLAFKSYVAEHTALDPASLVFCDDVISLIEVAREQGRKVVLVSASDHRIVHDVANHFGFFNEVFGTGSAKTQGVNLSGKSKAKFLTERYGADGFEYIGDCATDIPVWQAACTAFAVEPSLGLLAKARNAGVDLVIVSSKNKMESTWHHYARSLRPHQWSKNILVFLPMLAAQDISAVWLALMAFIVFSITASSVYVLNDLVDLPSDRAHPRKSRRPFAAGDISIARGIALAGGLLLLSLIASIALMPPLFLVALAFYFLITVAYSFFLKRKLIVDIITLAGLYTMRIIAGAAACSILPSPWLLAFSVFLFFALASIKRQAELVDQATHGKDASLGRAYLSSDVIVIQMMAISAGQAAVLIFALYLYSPDVAALYNRPEILWLICPVLLYWLSRISVLTHRGHMNDDPIVFAAKDKISIATGLVVLLIMLAAEHLG